MDDIGQIRKGVLRSHVTLLVVIAIVGALGWLGMSYSSTNMTLVVSDYPNIIGIYRLGELHSSIKADEGILLNQELDLTDAKRIYERIHRHWDDVDECWEMISDHKAEDQSWVSLWKGFESKWGKWKASHKRFITLSVKLDGLGYRDRYLQGRKVTEAEVDLLVRMGEYNQTINQTHYARVRKILNQITDSYMNEKIVNVERTNEVIRHITLSLLIIVLLSVVVASAYSIFMSQRISQKNQDIFRKIGSVNERLRQEVVEREYAEHSLREKEEDLRITLNSIGDAVIATDDAGRIVRMNPIAEALTGWNFEDANGHSLCDVFHIVNADTREAPESPVDKVIRTGEIVGLANHTLLIARDGTERQIADSGAPIRNSEDVIVGIVLVFRDITEQHKIEDQLRQSQKMDSIGQLAGGIAHDFNNMLGGIMGFADILNHRLQKDELLKGYAETIVKTAQRAADLTEKLLAFSRKGKAQTLPVNMHRTIEDALTLLKRTIDPRIEIAHDLKAELFRVEGDPSQLQNCILNIGVNARDAMPNGGTLTIRTENTVLDETYCRLSPFDIAPDEHIEITLEDTGTGISPSIQSSIFEPFFTTKEVGEGTGLGLAAVYGTVKEHRGAITVYSELEKGTAIHIYFPVSRMKEEKIPRARTEVPFTGGCVLVVDDEEVIRLMAVEILKEMGCETILAQDGEEGLRLYREHKDKIDVVLLDVVMPKMTGQECFHEIRTVNPEAKILISSGFTRDSSLSELMNHGLLGFIKKPYRRSEFGETLTKAMMND